MIRLLAGVCLLNATHAAASNGKATLKLMPL